MFPLLSGVLPRNDLQIDLAGPLAPRACRYPCRGLIEIQFRQVELIATLRASVYALPFASLTQLWCIRAHHRLSLLISPPGMARGEFLQQDATAFADGPSDEFRRIGHGLANDFKDI